MKKFKEQLNTVVFTTRFIMKTNSPILFIYHFDDGSWQFSGTEGDLEDSDFMVVSLEEIINHDPSVVEVSDLPIGFTAIRSSLGSQWKIISDN